MDISNDQVIEALKFLHILALCMGLGGAIFANLLGLRLLLSTREGALDGVFFHIHDFVLIGLVVLWASGLGLAVLRFNLSDVPLKVLAKIALVSILTMNSARIRERILPLVRCRHRPLIMHLPPGCLDDVVLLGSISFTCWFSALMLAKFTILQQLPAVKVVGLVIFFWGVSGIALYAIFTVARIAMRRRFAESG